MDKIVAICLALIIALVAGLAGTTAYGIYTESAYRTSISGTSSYTCTISTDAPLYNVTLFLPVPADPAGNSPVVTAFSAHEVGGVPQDWQTTLFDTGKATLIKVVTPAVLPPEGTAKDHPYAITLSVNSVQRSATATRDIAETGAVFRPVQDLAEDACTQAVAGNGGRCRSFTTSLFADYQTANGTTVTITSGITGKNAWSIFGPQTNEYHATVSTTITGENHGWVTMNGNLADGIGSYDIPAGAAGNQTQKNP